MKPLICPQCGGKITEYSPRQQFAVCDYCETKLVIETEKQNFYAFTEPEYEPIDSSSPGRNVFISVITVAILVVFGVFFTAILTSKKDPKTTYPVYKPQVYPTPIPISSPAPNPNLLEFGGKGTGNGLFDDAAAIAVDKQGRIYVADNSLRVQQFNEQGEFIKVWQIPTETLYYKRARSIEKIAVNDKDQLYVLVGGIVLIYENTGSQPLKIVHFAPNPIQDFVLRSDGGRLFLINDGELEYLVQVTETGKTVRRVNGFHTNAADAAMSPYQTGLAAIRMAVDGAGNIYSVYAFGDLGSYELSYNAEDLLIFRFTPEGKYVNKFVQTMNSCGIEVDSKSRIYISDNDSINIYSNTGENLANVFGVSSINAFALDKQGGIYILKDDKVIKRPAIN